MSLLTTDSGLVRALSEGMTPKFLATRSMNTDLLRYNAYTGIRNAGIVAARALLGHFRLSKLRVVADCLLARMAARPSNEPDQNAPPMPLPVRRAYKLMGAVRVLAFVDDSGYLLPVPAMSLQPAGHRTPVCSERIAAAWLAPLSTGTLVAASLLTPDVVSFQTKGHWLGSRRVLGLPVGAMAVTSVYAGGPPIPGRQVA